MHQPCQFGSHGYTSNECHKAIRLNRFNGSNRLDRFNRFEPLNRLNRLDEAGHGRTAITVIAAIKQDASEADGAAITRHCVAPPTR